MKVVVGFLGHLNSILISYKACISFHFPLVFLIFIFPLLIFYFRVVYASDLGGRKKACHFSCYEIWISEAVFAASSGSSIRMLKRIPLIFKSNRHVLSSDV